MCIRVARVWVSIVQRLLNMVLEVQALRGCTLSGVCPAKPSSAAAAAAAAHSLCHVASKDEMHAWCRLDRRLNAHEASEPLLH